MSQKPRSPMPVALGVEPGPERYYRCPVCGHESEAWRFIVRDDGIHCGACQKLPMDFYYPKPGPGLTRRALSVGVSHAGR